MLRLGIQGRRERSSHSVELSAGAKARLKRHAAALAEAIDGSDMPETRRAKLRIKLREFTDELDKERSSIARMMAAVGVVAAALTPIVGLIGSAEDDLAKVPKVIEAIQKITLLVGHEKGVEIDHAPTPSRVPAAAPKQIEDKSARGFGRVRATRPNENFPADLDDDIPF